MVQTLRERRRDRGRERERERDKEREAEREEFVTFFNQIPVPKWEYAKASVAYDP